MYVIYSHGIDSTNCHLMPWKNILEVTKGWVKSSQGAMIISDSKNSGFEILDTIQVHFIKPLRSLDGQNEMISYCKIQKVKRIYYPIAPGSRNSVILRIIGQLGCELVWYFPGGWYGFKQVAISSFYIGFKKSLPYWYQTIYPKRWWINSLLRDSWNPVIAMTDYTADKLRNFGYPNNLVYSIVPGKSIIETTTSTKSNAILDHLQAVKPYFLFFGPAQSIRGTNQLLKAFHFFCMQNDVGNLILLFRPDKSVDTRSIKRKINEFKYHKRLFVRWDFITRDELYTHIKNCRAILKPFLLVPSEIPLAVIESTSFGKPVIGFRAGGTGQYIEKFGALAKYASSKDLASKMVRLMDDEDYYTTLCSRSLKTFSDHPTWGEVADCWASIPVKNES